MPKKKIHKRIAHKKHVGNTQPQENQEEVVAETSNEAVSSPQEVTAPAQTNSVVSQTPDVSPQVGSVSSSPQNMPQSEPVSVPSLADSPQVEPAGQSNPEEEKSEDTISADDSSESEREASEPIVAKNESGGRGGIFKILLSILKYLFIFAAGVAVGGFVISQKGSIDFFKQAVQKDDTSQKTKITSTPTPTEVSVDLTKYSITVLNGSEIEGEASKLRNSLEEEGFMVSSVGNASESSFLKTVIRTKTEVDEAYLEKLKTFLLKTYRLSDVEELEDSADDDIEIIIGAEPE